ncbi:uncharacterized protein LOC114745211 isoform X1 [Neltuma alba]|uniref:uncharacterized protein LOC114745211 isoform X1 n=1 Tax=Neltuma alba TaxID=207710 RepID=UPI0010A4FFB7|nr:uncharacterized protein LOC114745211 isoform X1 [Prosopis alba]
MYFMTTCTAKSLVHLTSLEVSNCGMLEEVVMTDDEGGSEEEVKFESLKYLELTCLTGLNSFCSGNHAFIFPSLVTLKVIGCHKMQNFSSGFIVAPFVKSVEVEDGKERWKGDLNSTIKQLFIDKAIGEGIEDDPKESSSSQIQEKSVGKSRALSIEEHGAESRADDEIVDLGKQEIHRLPIPHTGIDTQKICEIAETLLDQACQNTLSLTKVDAVVEIREMHETCGGDVAQDADNTLSITMVQDADGVRNQEMYKILDNALVPVAQNVVSSSVVYNAAIDPSTSQASEALIQDEVCNADGSQDLQLHASENLRVQTTRSIPNDGEENTEIKEMYKTIQRPLVQNAEDMFIPASIQDIATGTHVTQESIDKPFVQATRTAWDITIIQEKEELHDSDINLSKNLFNQITTSIAADNSETVGTPEVYESKGRFTVHDAQNVASHSMVDGAGKSDGSEIVLGNNLSRGTTNSAITAENRAPNDRAPSQASEAPSSSTPPDVCNSFKELDISVQLLPYLEAGVKKHPQVLNWLTTKRRRVFASSFLSLFAEVTRILRTTRRMNLTEDDRNYVRQCCAELQGVGFDDRWISYVHRRIEECGDEEDLEMKVEEVEDQLESINKELASMEESLVLLRDRSSRLHGYICLSTLINALFIILFFIIIYVYQKKN